MKVFMKFVIKSLLPLMLVTLFISCYDAQNVSPIVQQTPLAIIQTYKNPSPTVEKKKTDAPQSSIIGTIKQPPEGFGCYAVLDDMKKNQIFIVTDEGDGLMNIEGQDVLLKQINSVEHKGKNGKKIYEWIFGKKNIKAIFELSITKTENEGKHLFYDGKATVSTGINTQTVKIKATCYD